MRFSNPEAQKFIDRGSGKMRLLMEDAQKELDNFKVSMSGEGSRRGDAHKKIKGKSR